MTKGEAKKFMGLDSFCHQEPTFTISDIEDFIDKIYDDFEKELALEKLKVKTLKNAIDLLTNAVEDAK